MNLAYNFPIIFWNCACLITDSGGAQEIDEDGGIYFDEVETEEIVGIYEEENFEEYEYEDAPDRKSKKKKARSTNYDKIAIALGKMRQEGVVVEPPNINQSAYTFKPDVDNNTIIYGLSGLLGVGEDVIKDTIKNRPYASPKDYYQKVKPKKGAMISLIKAGAFDKMMDRKLCMGWFLYEVCDKKKRLTLQNLPGLIKYDKLPKEEEFITARRVYEFNRYLKAMCKGNAEYYKLDERAINFLIEIEQDELIEEGFKLAVKSWDKKVYQPWMDVFRAWIADDKEGILTNLNNTIFKEDWEKYATGTISAWEMEALCYYYHDHELIDVNRGKYGIQNFFKMPEEPVIDRTFEKGGKTINLFKLYKICGTCIAKDKAKSTVT
jgi:DNA polymerase-3 subunit alpha